MALSAPWFSTALQPGHLSAVLTATVILYPHGYLKTGNTIEYRAHADSNMASIMGGNYLADSINLGQARTFGYIAGRHIVGITAYEQEIDRAAHR
ncbi:MULTISPECIES: hypothetical protein [unclassified Pseudomonas]|uniref:hypothetical protein n=1 Tax=unclassified Pseudomonas TaxID=196821 RepID=UPI002AC8FFEA|nr:MULTISPECIES: hypothetical protein [unclassified Pseudomonas]MEB0044555.1 hypothetical protein [Pseudomonas sp. Dout3]MEB0095753.1 hypothetical protein [Pseudomonas sp. DC1.2]WPX61698.1 hypothetical protein RHM68_21810 [Pseudomonas sp. DC1.2]